MLRGGADFADLASYRAFVEAVDAQRRNHDVAAAFAVPVVAKPLSFDELYALVRRYCRPAGRA